MFELVIPKGEIFNEETSKLIRFPEVRLRLEHSLHTLSKWESIWEIPFLGQTKKTEEQVLSYVDIMCGGGVDQTTLSRMTRHQFGDIDKFLNAKHSATWFSDSGDQGSQNKIVTAEMFYYWMSAYNIPFECDRWPLQKLMNLIRIASIKTAEQNPKKNRRPQSQMLSERAALNAKRKAELGTTG